MKRVRIKICGITNLEDATACASFGADMIGLNFYPESPRCIELQRARTIVEVLPDGLCAVGVFVDTLAAEIRSTANAAGIECIQLHGNVSPETCRELAGEFRVIRAF